MQENGKQNIRVQENTSNQSTVLSSPSVCVYLGGTFAKGAAEGANVLEESAVAVKPQPKFSVPATIL